MCKILNVSTSGFYTWRNRPVSQYRKREEWLASEITRLFRLSKERYGSPRIYAQLRKCGVSVSKKRVARIMRQLGLKARCARVYMRKAKLHEFYARVSNIKKDLPKPTAVNQQWAGDVTFIKVKGQWLYLAAIIDLYSRRIIGWSLAKRKTMQLSLASLAMAVRKRNIRDEVLFHTDRGAEYSAYYVQDWLKRHNIKSSMNRPGYCTDNAEMESFFHTLKAELIKSTHFENERDLRTKVASYIQHFYNRQRLHSALDYVSPINYETKAQGA